MSTSEPEPLDQMDLRILQCLQEDARMPKAEIARRVGVVASAVSARVDRLEESGVVLRYEPVIEPSAVGLHFSAFVRVTVDEPAGKHGTADELAELSAVQEVHHVAGDDCLLVKVRVADARAFARFLREEIGRMDAVTSTRTTVVLETMKETARLPFPVGEGSE